MATETEVGVRCDTQGHYYVPCETREDKGPNGTIVEICSVYCQQCGRIKSLTDQEG